MLCVFEASDYSSQSGMVFFFLSFIPESHIWYLLIYLFVSLMRVTGLVFLNHITKYHPTAFEDVFIPHMFQRLVNTMYGQTGQAAKVLHVSKGFKPNISPLLVICLGRHVDLTRL
jgi:hypothetical protein